MLMSERSDRLRQAWRATKLTQSQLAERYGWNRNTLKSNLNGSMPFSFARAREYARAFRVSAEWLYDGSGPMKPAYEPGRQPVEIPLISWVSAGTFADIGQHDPQPDRFVYETGLPDSGNYFATYVVGDSMDRIAPDGAIIIVDVNDREPRAGRPYLFSLHGETTFKIYEPEPPRLEPLSTNPANKTIFIHNQEVIVIGRARRSILDLN